MHKIKVIIVDDHFIVRDGMRAQLERSEDINIIGEAEDGKQALELMKTLKPDIIFLDLDLPVINGFEVLEKIKVNYKNIKVIIISMHDKLEYVSRSIRLGANGFISKNISSADLLIAVDSVQSGNVFMCGKTIKMLIEHKRDEGLKEKLTPREAEVLELITRGFSTKEVADKLFTSEHTVRKHRENINAKLNIHSKAEAAIFAINAGLILPSESGFSIRPDFG